MPGMSPSSVERARTLRRWKLWGAICATIAVLVLAVGPLAGAVVNTILVETEVGQAAYLPWAGMLPAALEGVGGIALVNIVWRDLDTGLNRWCWFLVFAMLAAGMAAQGAHAVWYSEAERSLKLPTEWRVFVAFVPPISAMVTLHLVVDTIKTLIDQVRNLLVSQPAPVPKPEPTHVGGQPPAQRPRNAVADARDKRVIAIASSGRGGYRAVVRATGWSRGRAEAALKAARAQLGQPTQQQLGTQEATAA
jgi:hypothetical protein